MSWQLFLMGILPLIIFVIVDSFASFKVALAAAAIFAVVETVFNYVYFGEIDSVTWASLGLVVVLGYIAYRLDNSKIFKFQPVILALIMAAIVAYFQFFDEPILVKFIPKARMMMPHDQWMRLQEPIMLQKSARMSGHLIVMFLFHAAITAYAALRMSNLAWLLVRGIGFWVLAGIVVLVNSIF